MNLNFEIALFCHILWWKGPLKNGILYFQGKQNICYLWIKSNNTYRLRYILGRLLTGLVFYGITLKTIAQQAVRVLVLFTGRCWKILNFLPSSIFLISFNFIFNDFSYFLNSFSTLQVPTSFDIFILDLPSVSKLLDFF